MFNILTNHAIRKTSSLPKPLKTLLICLAVFDLGVDLFGQPFYNGLPTMALLQNNTGCIINSSFVNVLGVFCSYHGFKTFNWRQIPAYSI